MSHVLLSGDTDRYPGLHTLLMGWGMTVGHFAGRQRGAYPDLGECDLVIHVCPETADPGAMPDGAQAAGGAARAAAPLLVIGGPGEVPAACAMVPDPGPEGIRLRAALNICLAHGRWLRDGGEDSRLEHLQFLGHELRSPLAAIKTALDVLAREDTDDAAVGRMLGIATRNVDRLTGAVEWSQDLMELEEAPPVARLDEVTLAELIRHLREAGWSIAATADSTRTVLTDPQLLTQLVGQLGRVMDSIYPGQGRHLTLEPVAGDQGIRMAMLTDREDQPVAGLQAGQPAGWDTGSAEPDSPAQRLIAVLTAPYLQEVLGVRPRDIETPSGLRGVCFDLPLPLAVPTA